MPSRTGEILTGHPIPRRGMGWGYGLMGLEIGGHQIPCRGRGGGEEKKASVQSGVGLTHSPRGLSWKPEAPLCLRIPI